MWRQPSPPAAGAPAQLARRNQRALPPPTQTFVPFSVDGSPSNAGYRRHLAHFSPSADDDDGAYDGGRPNRAAAAAAAASAASEGYRVSVENINEMLGESSREVLSGTFSPTIGKAIGFVRIPAGEPGEVRVEIRGREVPVRLVKFPFVREGKVQDGI
jgi:hypothetical protein